MGPMTPKFEFRQDFCTMHLATKFHHPTFNRSEVIMLTNTPTNANETIYPILIASGALWE